MIDNTAPSTDQSVSSGAAPLPVVVGIDGSANAENAAVWAAGEAERRGTRLVVVHAVSLQDTPSAPLDPYDRAVRRRAAARALLEQTAAALRSRFPGLEIETESSELAPARSLVERSGSAALTVTGTRGHGGFTGMLIGSVSRKLAAHAQCPLVVLRATQQPEADEVVLGVGRKPAPTAVRFAFETARSLGAELVVVRAWWPEAVYGALVAPGAMFVGELDTARESAMTGAEEAIAELREEFRDVKVRVSAVEGNPVSVLVHAARGARLLVVGGHRHRGRLSVGAGYVVEGVIAHSPTPVAVVPVR
jgi:nucleotide-binding universal stress UspA family protein